MTFSPVRQLEGVSFAAIGLTNMLNAGGAILDCQLRQSSSSNGYGSQKNGRRHSLVGMPQAGDANNSSSLEQTVLHVQEEL